MPNIFPPQTNRYVFRSLLVIVAIGVLLVAGIYLQQFGGWSYAPEQPIPFSHRVHVGKLNMDCTYCHASADKSRHAGMPDTQSCMGCHTHILPNSPLIAPLRRAADPTYSEYDGKPVAWVMVNRLAAHAYFNHQAHVTRGVSCVSCHGDVSQIDVMSANKDSKMKWCMECHRDPIESLRPLDAVTAANWSVEEYLRKNPLRGLDGQPIQNQRALGEFLQYQWKIQPKMDCTTCHH